jgi:acid phosphatase (class A)
VKHKIFRICFTVLSIAFIAGCTGLEKHNKLEPVPEVLPGVLQGYLPLEATPNSLALIPPPPSDGSAALALDRDVNLQSLALRGTPRWDLAVEDAQLMFPEAAGTFSCAINAPINEQQTPQLYRLLRRSLADAGFSTYAAKNHYQRARPFVVNKEPICTPADEERLMESASYPSGHTAIGWAWALILAEVSPNQSDAILKRGWAYGQSRMICNVHWQSDVTMGRIMGSATVAKLHADPAFVAAIAAAKDEIKAAHAKGLKPTRDCKAEADALGRSPEPGSNLRI